MVESGEKWCLTMFLGNYLSKLDTVKGRTSIPVKFRHLLGKKAIITQGYEKSLILIRADQWVKVTRHLRKASFLTGVARQTERFLLGSAFQIELDNQGRFIIPQALRQYAALEKQVVFVGVGSRVEIWGKTGWQKQSKYLAENIAQISEKLDEKIAKQ